MNFVELENKGKKILAKFPKIRRLFKGIYQRCMFLVSSEKIKSIGDIRKISPDNFEYFFGYYDKTPWDATNRYMISLKVKNAYKEPDSCEIAEIIVFDTKNNNEIENIGITHCWNSQQGCMAQWLGPDFKTKIIYNDFREGKYVSVIYNFEKKQEEKVYNMPIYDVSKNGEFALSLDFSRLHRLRKGYGYANAQETTKNEFCPEKACIWKIDFKTGKIYEVIKYTDLSSFEPRNEMKNAIHKVNHIMINPDGDRFMVLHRWFKNNEKFTRLITMNVDGTDLYNLSDDNFVSHCCWKNDKEILSFLRKKETGDHYYLLKDKTTQFKMLWPELNVDGHCTYSPDGKYVITDTYPNRKRIAHIYLCTEKDNKVRKIASLFSPFKYDNDVRCDLHPRWNNIGDKICFDSVHEGNKGLYLLNNPLYEVSKNKEDKIPKIIHSIWIGNGKKSNIVKKCEESWYTFANDYKIIEWNEKNFDLNNVPQYVKEAYKEKKWAFVSDYMRLKVLYENGGIYLDTDMELFRKIDELLKYDGFLCIESKYTISTAIIATMKHAKWIKDLLDEYEKISFINDDGTYNVIPNTKRVYNYMVNNLSYNYSKEICKYQNGLVILPSEYFSPLNCFDGRKNITNKTYGMHHYDNTWKSRKEKIKKRILQLLTRIFGEDIRNKFSKK